MSDRRIFSADAFDIKGRYRHATLVDPGRPDADTAEIRFGQALQTAVIVPFREYIEGIIEPAIREGAVPWTAVASTGRLIQQKVPDLELDQIVVNGAAVRDPRMATIFAIEEAARYIHLRQAWFGPKGIFADPERLRQVRVEAPPGTVERITPKQVVTGGCIDPMLEMEESRQYGLEIGHKVAFSIGGRDLAQNHTQMNIALAEQMQRRDVPTVSSMGESQIRMMREVYRTLFD